jgi:Ni,Fe-hydrogenase III large subunit
VKAIERVESGRWRERIECALDAGEQFGGAWASGKAADRTWRALLFTPHDRCVISCDASAGRVQSIVEVVEAAGWDEREAHDLRGLEFSGHFPMRALAEHVDDPGGWMTPVAGEGVSQVAVGPIHAGVIESGHFRFHVVGERILAMDPRLFYKHRGLEHAAENHDAAGAIAHIGRACAACSVTNTVAYAQAVESALGLQANRDLRVARTVLLELERLYNHLNDIGAICSGAGFAPGAMTLAALKDRAQQLNLRLCGHRFLFGSVAVAGGNLAIEQAGADAALGELRELRSDTAAAWREIEFAGAVHARLDGVGVLTAEDALRLGAVGPAARASGLRDDVRCWSPELAYEDFQPAVLASPDGDVGARLRLRAGELETTYDLLEDLLTQAFGAGTASGGEEAGPIGIGRVESPRGATMCAVELAGRRVARVHLRTGSYANWPALAHAVAGNLLPDFPLINKSFELCYACVDR